MHVDLELHWNKTRFLCCLIMLMFSLFLWFSHMLGYTTRALGNKQFLLFDFGRDHSVAGWVESSDTVREVGMSKAVLTTQKTQVFQRAILFTLLNPQPNGAGFAGVNFHSNWNLSDYSSIDIHCRGQGQNNGYKVVLRHKNLNREPYPTYEQTFTAPMNEFATISLPFTDFKPFYRGRPLNETEVGALDTSFITSIGLQVYGGVYLPYKQFGASSLEIDWMIATSPTSS